MREPVNHKIPVDNARKLRPVGMMSTKHSKFVAFQFHKTHEVKGVKFTFPTPNNISVCLNIGDREYEMAKALYQHLIYPKLATGQKQISFSAPEVDVLYNYFEHLQTSLIAIYTAVEAYCNIAIPEDFEYEKVNSKKVKETWGKEAIERWLSTTEKICDILPKILEVPAPKKETFWNDFRKLETIRNNIIHQKTVMQESNVNSDYLEHFFDDNIFHIIRSGLLVIEYFCNNSKEPHVYFPIGMGSTKIIPVVVENLEDYFDEIPGLRDFMK